MLKERVVLSERGPLLKTPSPRKSALKDCSPRRDTFMDLRVLPLVKVLLLISNILFKVYILTERIILIILFPRERGRERERYIFLATS